MTPHNQTKQVSFSRRTTMLALAGIILFHLANNLLWLYLDRSSLVFDAHHHFMLSLRIFRMIQEGTVPLFSTLVQQVPDLRWHGVLVGYLTAPFYFLFGPSQDTGVMVNSSIFITVLVLSVFGTATAVKNQRAGLWAAFIVGMYPLIFIHERLYMLDLPLTALVSLSIYLLIRSDYFRHTLYTVLFWIAFAAGILVKINFLGFVLPVLLVWLGGIPNAPRQKGLAKWIFFGIVAAFLITFPFYRLKWFEVANRLYQCSWINPEFYAPHTSFASLAAYWFNTTARFLTWGVGTLMNNGISFVLFLPLVVSLCAIGRKPYPYRFLLFVWLAAPLFILTVFFHSTTIDRYLMPILPCCAIITALGIEAIAHNKNGRLVAALLALVFLAQFFAISYAAPLSLPRFSITLPWGNNLPVEPSLDSLVLWDPIRTTSLRNGSHTFGVSPSPRVWPTEELLKEIPHQDPSPTIFFYQPLHELYDPLEYLIIRDKIPVSLSIVSREEEKFYQKEQLELETFITAADYIVSSAGDTGQDTAEDSPERCMDAGTKLLKDRKKEFSLIKEFPLLTQGTLQLYRRTNQFIDIGNGALKLFYRDGIFRIYYRDNELTNFPGLQATLEWKQKRYLTREARWQLRRVSPNALEMAALWENVPFQQIWNVAITGPNTIQVRQQTISSESVRLHINTLDYTMPVSYTLEPAPVPAHRVIEDANTYYYELPPEMRSFRLRPNTSRLPTITLTATSAFGAMTPYLIVTKTSRLIALQLQDNARTMISSLDPGTPHPTTITITIGEEKE